MADEHLALTPSADGRVADEQMALTPSADGHVVDQQVWALTPSGDGHVIEEYLVCEERRRTMNEKGIFWSKKAIFQVKFIRSTVFFFCLLDVYKEMV